MKPFIHYCKTFNYIPGVDNGLSFKEQYDNLGKMVSTWYSDLRNEYSFLSDEMFDLCYFHTISYHTTGYCDYESLETIEWFDDVIFNMQNIVNFACAVNPNLRK